MQRACVVRRPVVVGQNETPLPIEPRNGALNDPTMASHAWLRRDASARNTVLEAARPAGVPALTEVVALVGMCLARPVARPTGTAVITAGIGSSISLKIWLSWTIDLVRLTARGIPGASSAIWRLQPGRPLYVEFGPVMLPPRIAATIELSMAARSQSMSSALAKR